jgi:molybdate transport system ATP-binding protein
VFSFHNATLSNNGTTIVEGFDLDVHAGESWWICGANGSGKTTMLETIAGHQRCSGGEMILHGSTSPEEFFASVAYIPGDLSMFRGFTRSAGFYQQRYFSVGVEETPTVSAFVKAEIGIEEDRIHVTATLLKVENLLDRHIISLSTGEVRRILLLMLYLTGRNLICFDDPYSGLDSKGKKLVSHAIKALLGRKLTIMASGSDLAPPYPFSHVLYLENKKAAYKGDSQLFTHHLNKSLTQSGKVCLKSHVPDEYDYDFGIVAEMKNITIRYEDTVVQKDFSWKITRGDKWMLTGPNGSGKSTLMSLVYGDNPMAYAYRLVIFGKVRGTGESIWEIKRKIGYFSSELQHFFPMSLTFYEAVLTGFSDHLMVRKDLTSEHHLQALDLIDSTGMTQLKEMPFYRLSFSQRRLSLICRALVKHPPVIILDEPCQGLDRTTTKIINRLVDAVCGHNDKTLIYVTHRPEDVPEIINRHLEILKTES